MMNSPTELDKDTVKLNEQVIWDAENEENNTSTDTHLPPAPTETEALFTHNVSVCPNNEDKAGTGEYMESEKRLAFEVRTLETSLNEQERKKSSEYEAERENRHCEEMKKEERKRQIEREFQKELKKIMEAEKLHQKELELMEKRAQEKLEQELLLQQELISNLKRRVEEERRMREEEQKRMEDEADKRKREEEKLKVEAERKRMEEEMRRKKEEERKIEEMKLKKEKERKKEEQEKRRMGREEKRKREEERNKMDLEKKKLEDEMRMMKEEEERKNKEEVERIKKEEEGKREEERRIEEAKKKLEKEKRNMEEEISMKKEQECRKKEEEDRKKREEKNMRIEEEGRITKEIEERKKQEEMRKKKEEEEADDRNKVYEEMRKSYKREHGNVDEEIKLEERKKKEEKDMKKREEEARRREKETKKIEEKKEVKEVVRKREGENSKMKEELRPIEDDEKRKQEDEWKTKEEEPRRRQKEEMRRQRDEEDYRKSEEEIRLKEDKEGYKGYDNRKMEHERKTKDKEKKQQEEEEKKQGKEKMRTREEERKNVEAEKEQNGEEVRENKKEVNKKTEEEIRGKEKEESKTRSFQDREKEVKANELQEKRENNSMMGQNEKKNVDKTDNSLASQLEDGTTWTSSNLGPLHSESTISPTITETTPQQHGLDKNISQTSTMSVFIPVCLPEHTEQKRLSWMKDCIPWSKLSLQNRRKQKGSVQSRRGWRRVSEASSLPPLCPDSLLQSTGWKSLEEVTSVTLEDLPGCSLSTLTQCTQLRSLTLRRCGLKSLEGINQLPRLYYVDVQENDISFVDCENMTSLRVLQLAHNKLTSIHGLTGAENLNVLDLSHNSITRIAGLESMRRLQRLSVDHNQLISTKGLRDVYTLLYLNCSHNHLANMEGLENSALLNTLDLRANSLTEPPSLKNQVLLRELHLDDNSISSLQDLTACWLPLMQHLSVAQNRITQLPSMSDAVSLANLDLRFNCMSELQNVCESLEGCQFLREVHLAGNPLQQESGWRSTLQRAVPGLRAIDGQETDSFLSPPAVQQVSLALGSFLTFCQAQLQQTHDIQQQHSRELSDASSSLDAAKTSCRHFTEALQLAEDQRFAHEYGDTVVADKHRAAGQTTPEETLDMDTANAVKRTERPVMESTGKVPPIIPNRDNIRCSSWTFEEKSAAESRHDTFDTVATGPKTGPKVNKTNSGSVTIPSNLEMAPVSNHQSLDLQNTAAVVIQQLWRKYRQKCGNISSPSTAEKGGGRGGDGGKPESGPSYINQSQDYAATVIQAFWRGFTLRRRLASALAAVTCLDTGEDDTFEEVDVDEFVFDEAALEKHWTLSLSEDLPPRRYPVSEQPLSLKPPGPFPEPSQYILPPPLVWRSKQAWMAGEQVDSAGQRVSPVSSNGSKSPASNSVVTGLSERSEKILEEWGFTHSHTALLMLKRAQNMKSKKQQHKKRRDPAVRLALFRNCSYQLGPLEAQNRQAQNNRNYIKVREAEPGLQQAEKTERVKQERAQQWLHTQAAHSDRDSESAHFLPEISSDILNGGRVQLVADPGYTERLHHASGLWANSSLAAQPRKENNYPRRNSLGHARKEVPSPKRATSAPSKKERISFRDNPVQLSGGWGGGKKRDKVYK